MKIKNKLVKVFWRDIAGISSTDNSSAWLTKAQLSKEAKRLYEQQYVSVGYLVENNSKFIIVAATTDDEKDETLWSDASMIMKDVVIKIVSLKSKKGE